MNIIILRLVDHIKLPEPTMLDLFGLIFLILILILGFYFANKLQNKHFRGKKTYPLKSKRRAFVRVPVQMNVEVLNMENQSKCNVNLLDISAGGILLEGEPDKLSTLKFFQIISKISPWKDVDSPVFTVVRVKRDKANNKITLSCKFKKLPRSQKKVINQFVINKIKENLK